MTTLFEPSLRKSLLAGAMALAVTLPLAGKAEAAALAFATVVTSGAALYDATGVATAAGAAAAPILVHGVNLTVTGVSTTVAASGTLNGVTVNTGGIGFTDAPLACVGGGCAGIAQNDFTQQAFPPASSFSRGDSLLVGALVGGLAVPPPASANVVSETSLLGTATGNASSEVSTIAGFTFIATGSGEVGIRFDADPLLRVALDAASASGAAQSSISFSVQIVDVGTGAVLLDWTPNGAAGGITVGTEISDPTNLTRSISTATVGSDITVNPASGFFAANSLALTAGTAYSFNISLKSASNALSAPEPGILALFGTGLLGLGLLSRRRRRQTKV